MTKMEREELADAISAIEENGCLEREVNGHTVRLVRESESVYRLDTGTMPEDDAAKLRSYVESDLSKDFGPSLHLAE